MDLEVAPGTVGLLAAGRVTEGQEEALLLLRAEQDELQGLPLDGEAHLRSASIAALAAVGGRDHHKLPVSRLHADIEDQLRVRREVRQPRERRPLRRGYRRVRMVTEGRILVAAELLEGLQVHVQLPHNPIPSGGDACRA